MAKSKSSMRTVVMRTTLVLIPFLSSITMLRSNCWKNALSIPSLYVEAAGISNFYVTK